MTQITITETVIPNYQGGGAAASLRIYANQSFLTSNLVRIFKQKAPGPVWYKEIACTVAGSDLTIPEFVIDSTTDSNDESGTYTAILFDENHMQKDFFFKRYAVPVSLGVIISFAQLVAYNPQEPARHVSGSFTQDQTAALIAASIGDYWITVTKQDDEGKVLTIVPSLDEDLQFPMTENTVYAFEIVIFVRVEGGIPGFRFGVDGPAGPVETLFAHRREATDPTGETTGVITGGYGTIATMTINAAPNGYACIRMHGFVKNGVNAANFGLTWAQKTSSPTPTSILAGSSIKYKEVS